MENLSKKAALSLSLIGLIFVIASFSACSSENDTIKNSDVSSGGQSIANAEVNAANTAENKPATPIADLPVFKKDEDYKLSVREKLLKAGWKPARSATDGKENCVADSAFCREFPELEAGPSSPEGAAIFRWQKGKKTLLITAKGDPISFVRFEYEKTAAKENKNELGGKYIYADTSGIGGEYTLELNNGNLATLQILEEDATTKGSGSYKYDENDRILAVTFGLEIEIAGGDEGEKPKKSTVSFHFEKTGNDLKVVKAQRYEQLVGKIFKKN